MNEEILTDQLQAGHIPAELYRTGMVPVQNTVQRLRVDPALLTAVFCGCVGLGVLLVLLTHLVVALTALAPAGVGLTIRMNRGK